MSKRPVLRFTVTLLFLLSYFRSIFIVFRNVLCVLGILAHVYNPGRNLTYSYLSSDHVVDPHLVEFRLNDLVDSIYENHSVSAEKLQLMYNIENRWTWSYIISLSTVTLFACLL